MRSNQDTRRRLQVRRETFRRLSALSDRQLARAAGGTGGGFDDPTGPSDSCWGCDHEVMSRTSRLC